MNQMVTDIFLQGLEGLSHESLRHAIRYKEAVYQCKRSRVEMAKQEIDETSKLHTLLHSLSRDTDLECIMAERERNFFLKMLVDCQPTLPHPTTNMRYSIAAHTRDKKALSLADAELGLLQQHKGSLPLNVSQARTNSSVVSIRSTNPRYSSPATSIPALIMDISPSDYPWNKASIECLDYPWDDGQDLQDIICRIEEDFPPDSSNEGQPYDYVPYNNPLFQMFNSPQLNSPLPQAPLPQAPLPQAPPYPAPALTIAPTPFSPSLVPGPSAPSPASPSPASPAPSAPAPSTAATCTAPSESTFCSAPNPAPIIRPINFVMVMDGEKGRRISKKTGVMKPKPIVQPPPALNDYNPQKPLDNPKIVLIIQEVQKNILEATVRDTRLTDQKDREETVKFELIAAAQKHFPTDATSAAAWAERNWIVLYNELSKPMTEIMRKLKSTSETLYIQGYGLRPAARSPNALNEKNYAKAKVQQLIPPESPQPGVFASLAFIYNNLSNPLENPVIWDVVLNTINSLGYNQYLGDPESLDCLFIAAVSAVYCCLDQVPKGKKLLFMKEDYGFIYNRVELFMEDVIYADQVKTANWIVYRKITHIKLTT
ncbi:hypothetical protein F4604DRAFT_1680107 [Suillus subluteus]|nr:hypothetical protein F4604DRAFT_1680107 [Suillus subluteus]